MIYCLDFDGTIIPPIHYKNDKQFFRSTLRAKTFLSEEEIKFFNSNQPVILTDRPEDGILVVEAYCCKIGLDIKRVISSYGPNYIRPSSRKKIVLKKAAIMVFLAPDSSFEYGFNHHVCYIDKDLAMMADVNNLYKRLMKMKIEPFKRDK